MKKIILFSAFVAFCFANSFGQKDPGSTGTVTPIGNPTATESGPQIVFSKETHDYGTIQQHGNGVYEFVFKNNGNAPLIISNAKGSCGCTVPEWPKEPIAPGASNTIKVKYDTKRVGPFSKSVTIMSNATNAPTQTIRIKGTVEAAVDAVPVNKTGAPSNN